MSPQKDDTTTRQTQEQHTEGKVSPWILGNPITTSKMGSQSASIATSIDT